MIFLIIKMKKPLKEMMIPILEDLSARLRERRAKNLKRQQEALREGVANTLEIEKCQSIAPDNDTYFES